MTNSVGVVLPGLTTNAAAVLIVGAICLTVVLWKFMDSF